MDACARTRNCNGRRDDLHITVVIAAAATALTIANNFSFHLRHACAIPLRSSLAQNRR
jgi:hypothetical protein